MSRIERIAVLNRGEPARRCLRAIRELRAEEGSNLVGIALFTDTDPRSPYVREADERLSLGPALRRSNGGDLRPAYLDHDRVMAALRAVRADAVWPGWGFLAEDPSFVERLESAGIVFLGPRAETMRALGDKIMSKKLAEAAGVPVAPWSGGPVEADELRSTAEKIGYPLMIKATAGGGGRGIRRVESTDEIEAAFRSASSEAAHAFGDGALFLESCLDGARHVEVQMAADTHGRVLALGVRDCSVQRRHQKVIEETPPPRLPSELRAEMCGASVRLLEQMRYSGVATVEFLLTAEPRFCFLEVNPRLQVEHGVTELLSDFDLVKAQIRIARGEHLPETPPPERGHAIEVRVCAEDPAAGFVPTPGHIALLDLPSGPGIRVDSGIAAGETIPGEFDSMLAKIIASGSTRDEARARLVRAVSEVRLVIEGGMTNKGFLLDILAHPDFRSGSCDTGWLDRAGLATAPAPEIDALLVAAILTYQRERASVRLNFYVEAARGRPRQIPPSTGREIDLVYAGVPYRFTVFAIGGWTYRAYLGERVVQVRLLEQGPYARLLEVGERRRSVLFSESDVELRIELDGRLHRVDRDVGGKVRAPAPALLIEIATRPGETVTAGERLGLLEAMKTETAFFAPVSGVVREILLRPGERVAAGDVILVIEPSAQEGASSAGVAREVLELELVPDPLEAFRDPETELWDFGRALSVSPATRAGAVGALRSEVRRIATGYDVNPERAESVIQALEAGLDGVPEPLLAELAQLARQVSVFADVETLFTRTPTRTQTAELGPSNDARMAMYLRRLGVEGAGIAPGFLTQVLRALEHYDISSLEPTDSLQRAVLRLHATRTTKELRNRVLAALLHLLIRLDERGQTFARYPNLADALDRLVLLRGTVTTGVADLAAQARFALFDRALERERELPSPASIDLEAGMLPAPDSHALAARARELGVPLDVARRIELWRLDNFELEPIESLPGIYAFYGRARRQAGDERIFCFAEITEAIPGAPLDPDLAVFEQRFHKAIEAMRSIQSELDPAHRLHWNRLYLFVRSPIVLAQPLIDEAMRRLAPETGNLGLEKVIVRLLVLDSDRSDAELRPLEVLTGNPTGSRVEFELRAPHAEPLGPATEYERRVAAARARGLVYPFEIIRLFTAASGSESTRIGSPTGPGHFLEYELSGERVEPVGRPPGGNSCGVVIGVITTPTEKYPEGIRRVLIVSDSTFGMGALASPECDRIVAAIDLAEREEMPVEWVALSSGARIAMETGTENLDATARVVRRIVTFTDAGGEINLILSGVNVGAQSYFDALATMGLQTRGILIMLSNASMVLTGRAALEVSGGVAAEDEVGIGGYERIMGLSGQAHFQARDIADAYAILLDHYAHSFRAPGEPGPRRFRTRDPRDRDVVEYPYQGEEGFRTVGEIFSLDANAERKRPFAMRQLMRALVDHDAGWLELWRDWVGADTAIVWNAHLGGHAVALIGIESRPVPRLGSVPNDGPDAWTAGTLFPLSSKKVARAINAASGNRPVLILANLSGFDGSPESMRRGILEYGAEIARAVVRFDGKFLFTVVSRYHGGAYVVFSRELNDQMRVGALEGSFASVIGGSAAALTVFPRNVRARANADPRVEEARARIEVATDPAMRAARRARFEQVFQEVSLEKQAEVAAEFDAIHTVERAREVGSLEAILDPREIRPRLIAWLEDD
jgi:acetyl/propionyl-CoA carboxylase alpha subunit/acetyl-CoA carboxylase carboxyltransferase component